MGEKIYLKDIYFYETLNSIDFVVEFTSENITEILEEKNIELCKEILKKQINRNEEIIKDIFEEKDFVGSETVINTRFSGNDFVFNISIPNDNIPSVLEEIDKLKF